MTNPKLWWVTRPTRKPLDMDEALIEFTKIAEGKKWNGNKKLQEEFELKNPAKTPNKGEYGSGGRTWAALLNQYGLWHNPNNVTITEAGRAIIDGKDRYGQTQQQILNLQHPSAYVEHKKLEDGFRIFPFRFLLRLLLDKRLEYLAEIEVALLIINTKTDSEYKSKVTKILAFRKHNKRDRIPAHLLLQKHDRLISAHMKKYANDRFVKKQENKLYLKYLKDITNTFFNNIRYIHEVDYEKGTLNDDGRIFIKPKNREKIKKLLDCYEVNHPFSTRYKISDGFFFAHYGLEVGKKKASKKATPPKTPQVKMYNKIQRSLETFRKKNPVRKKESEVVAHIAHDTGISKQEIEEVFNENWDDLGLVNLDHIDKLFKTEYLRVAKSGVDDQEFEEMTRDIFRIFGFPTEKCLIPKKYGNGYYEIDGFNQNCTIMRSGILECKSGAKYTFPNSLCDLMVTSYIPKFKGYKPNGKSFSLDFFVYVIGNAYTGYDNFTDIIRRSDTDGTVILAKNLLLILEQFKAKKITKNKIWKKFSGNREITRNDLS